MQTQLTTADVNGRWLVFKDGADLSDYDPAKLTLWTFESKDCTTGSLIRVQDAISTMSLTRDAGGAYDQGAYFLAYNLAFAKEHVTKITRGDQETDPAEAKDIDGLPPAVLSAFVLRADTSRGVSDDDLQSLKVKKPKPSDGGSGSESGS